MALDCFTAIDRALRSQWLGKHTKLYLSWTVLCREVCREVCREAGRLYEPCAPAKFTSPAAGDTLGYP